MKLLTKELSAQLQRQFHEGSRQEQMVVCKFFTPWSSWTWYVMNQDPEHPDYLWGIVRGEEVESGSFSLSELESVRGPFGLKVERDISFTPVPAMEVMKKLVGGAR
jgi:hypothetical protein